MKQHPPVVLPAPNGTSSPGEGSKTFPSVRIRSNRLRQAADPRYRLAEYSATTPVVRRSPSGAQVDVELDQKTYLIETDTQAPAKLGLMMVGLGGNNGSTLTAALLAHQHGLTWRTKHGVQSPNFFGSLLLASSTTLGYDAADGAPVSVPLAQLAPFADPLGIVIGGWDTSAMDLEGAVDRAQVLDVDLQRQLGPLLRQIKPLPAIYDAGFVASNQTDRADNVVAEDGRWAQVGAVRDHIREFRRQHGVDRVVVVWTATTERFCDVIDGVHDTADNLIQAVKANHAELSPSTLFALAAVLEHCPFVNGSPQNTLVPGLVDLAARMDVPVAGDDFKSGQTKLKSVLADFLISSGIKPVAIVSYNHLGNNDGRNLHEDAQFRSKRASKSGVVRDLVAANPILYPDGDDDGPDHVVVIEYVPAVGDSKRAMDEYVSEVFMGGRSTVAIHNVCEDSLLAAPIILDLVLLCDLITRVRVARRPGPEHTAPIFEKMHPVASLLAFMLKAPVVPGHAPVVNALMKQRRAIETFLRACVGLPPVDDLMLDCRLKQTLKP